MKVKVGKISVPLEDFISAVLANVSNKEIWFEINDADLNAIARFRTIKMMGIIHSGDINDYEIKDKDFIPLQPKK